MNKRKIQHIAFGASLTISILFSMRLSAQDSTIVIPDTTSMSQDTVVSFIKTDNVEVIKAFEVKLADAVMLNINPKIPEIIPALKKYPYNVTIVPYKISYPDPVIKPIAMRRDDPSSYRNISLKAGYGNLMNPFADLNIHHNFSDLFDWNLGVHYEALDNSSEIALQKYSDLSVKTDLGFSLMETSRIDLSLNGGLEKRFFYYDAGDRTSELNEDIADRDITRLGAAIKFYNAYENSAKVDYLLDLSTRYTQITDLGEYELNSKAYVAFTKSKNSKLAFTFSGGGDFNTSYGKTDIVGILDPHITIAGSKASIDAGLDYIYANETSYVFPRGLIKYSLDKDILQVFAGVDQNYFRNNMANITAYNPFSTGFDTMTTTVIRDFFGGVQGRILGLTYSAKAGYKDISNQAYFNTDFQDTLRRLTLEVADLNAIYVSGTLEVPVTNFLTAGGSVTQNFFNDISSVELWHVPKLELNAYANLSFFKDKINIKSNLFIADGIEAQTPSGKETLEDLIDFNIDVELKPIKNAGIYVRGKNLFDKNYRRWYSYPNVGIHVEGGIILIF
jgi:hypothetical protein